MSVQYDLSFKPRKPLGLRRNDYQYQKSLHQPRPMLPVKKESLTEEEINAAPVSSDEELPTKREHEDAQSDDSLPTASGRKRKSSSLEAAGKSEESTSVKAEDDEGASGLDSSLSNIPTSTFELGKGSRSRSGSRGSQKRVKVDEGLDPMDMWSSLPKRQKTTTYSASSQPLNIHLKGNTGGLKTPKRKGNASSSKAQKNGKQVDEREANSKNPQLRMPVPIPSSPRSQRASHRSTQSTQKSSQGSQMPEFKMPKNVKPKKRKPRPTFKGVPVLGGDDTSGKTRSLEPADANFQNAKRVAAEKLGISIPRFRPPSLSSSLSSADSAYLDALNQEPSITSPSEDAAANPRQEDSYCITSEDMPIFTKKTGPSLCPFCREPVGKLFLEETMKIGERLTIRQQAQVCKSHKREAAEDEWRGKGYPTIDWPSFDGRLDHYHLALDDILQRRRISFYRNAFDDLVKSGKNWTWQQDVMSGNRVEELSPGYYGGRGAKLMMENIMSKFASKIRRLAKSDNLISTGGVSGFVQAVLVPELAVMLVQSDMSIDDEEKAREVLRNSVEIGHMLNEEEDETIQDPDLEDSQAMEET